MELQPERDKDRWRHLMIYYVKFDVQGRGTAPATQYIYIMYPGSSMYPGSDLYPGSDPYAQRPADPHTDEYRFGGWFTDLTYEYE